MSILTLSTTTIATQPPLVADLLLALAIIAGAAVCTVAALAAAQALRLDAVLLRAHSAQVRTITPLLPLAGPVMLAGAALAGLGLLPAGPMPLLAGLLALGGFMAIALAPQRPAQSARPAIVVKTPAPISKAA